MLEPLKDMTKKLNAAAEKAMAEINALEKELQDMHCGLETWIPCHNSDGLSLGYARIANTFRVAVSSTNYQTVKPVAECKREVKIEAAKHLSLLIDAIVKKMAVLIGEKL